MDGDTNNLIWWVALNTVQLQSGYKWYIINIMYLLVIARSQHFMILFIFTMKRLV